MIVRRLASDAQRELARRRVAAARLRRLRETQHHHGGRIGEAADDRQRGVEVLGDRSIPVIAVAAPLTEAQEAAALEAATAPLGEAAVVGEKDAAEETAAPAKKA